MRRLAVLFVTLAFVASSALLKNQWRAHAENATAEVADPEVVGAGVISTDDDELGGGVTPDGKTLIFEKSAAPHYLYILCESQLVDGKWSRPEILPFSGQYRDTDPVIAPDGESILFASDRPASGQDLHRWSIWRAQRRVDGKWANPELLTGSVNSEGSQVFASIAANGNIYFASSRKTGNYDVFRSKLVNGKYLEAEDLGPNLNGPAVNTFEALIAPDESYLLMGSFGRDGGFGSSDLWVSFPEGSVWSKPINLGPKINGRARDYSPRVTADGKWLYYTSEKGFLDEQRDQPFTFDELSRGLAGVGNGLGNLYRVPLQPVLEAARRSFQNEK